MVCLKSEEVVNATFPVLLDEHLVVSDVVVDPNTRDTKSRKLSWIWHRKPLHEDTNWARESEPEFLFIVHIITVCD